ncbi:inositol monophosphatase family protein [Paenibacillus sp.]|uniref:inositol monophosphatase family protein n=1 Tax=Paenibacillus sp. TaxID=58172 RepID=UPI002D4A43B7|nr:inositol monophosphatase family protein [Paenibacillus sp.]HZG83465.1 inositol monophosphatase family protein [Paenibacillus sp.]
MSNHERETYTVTGKSFTAVAVNMAAKAGEYMKSKLGQATDVRVKTSPHDLVTEVDKGTEILIRKIIHTYFPTHDILGEEGVEPGAEASRLALEAVKDREYVWIVDPIDGTTNFIHGLPFYSVSIALAHRGEVIVGVVYDPSRDELFVAEKGKGAYVHGKRIQVSPEEELAGSLVATGFPTDRQHVLPLALKQIESVAPRVRNIRAGGSAALHLAYVAAGRLTGFWEANLNAWDIAAGMLLVQEAGGKVTDMNGEPYGLHVRDVAATNGRIHDDLIAAIR